MTFQDCREGGEVILECETTGFPIPEFHWYRNSIPVKSNEEMEIVNLKNENRSRYCLIKNKLNKCFDEKQNIALMICFTQIKCLVN